MFDAVHVEARFLAAHFDLYFGPLSRDQIDVRFVLSREFLAQHVPRKAGVRNVLSGMVPPLLILRASIRRAQVETLESRRVWRNPECDSHESARACVSVGSRLS